MSGVEQKNPAAFSIPAEIFAGVGSPDSTVENNKVITSGITRLEPSTYTDRYKIRGLVYCVYPLWGGGTGEGLAALVCILHLFPYTVIRIK